MLKVKFPVLAILTPFLVASLVFSQVVGATELIISDNGSNSENSQNIQSTSSTVTVQSNSGDSSNSVSTDSQTGGNSASGNISAGTSIDTGSASNTVELSNNVNTSLVEVGCCPQETNVEISGNGSESQNTVIFEQTNSTDVEVFQNVIIKNNIVGYANTGGNTSSENSGDVSIKTGDVKVESVIRNLANASLVSTSGGGSDSSVKVFENATGSENEINAFLNNKTNVFTHTSTDIENFLTWDLNTGKNKANKNNGDVTIETGDISLQLFIENLANLGGVDVDCCESIFDPGEEAEDEEDEGGEEGQEEGEEEEEREDEGDDEDDEEGEILPEAAATEAGGPGIIGLSDTSSGEAQALFFFISLVMISLGSKIVTDELLVKTSRRRLNGEKKVFTP